MKTRLFTNNDHKMISNWWLETGCPVPHLSQLQTIGVIGYADNEPACAVWAYKSEGVAVAFLEHLITNPAIKSPMAKMRAVVAMMERILKDLSDDGYQIIRGTTWSLTLAKICKKRWGFEIIDEESVNMSLML